MYSMFISTRFEAAIAEQIAATFGFEQLKFYHHLTSAVFSPHSHDPRARQANLAIVAVLQRYRWDCRDHGEEAARLMAQHDASRVRLSSSEEKNKPA